MTANPIPVAPPRPVLYRSEIVGRWWPGVSRACVNCIGGWLLLDGDNVHCLNCAHEAYEVKDAPKKPVVIEPWEPSKPGPRPKIAQKVPTGTCRNGHERTLENTYFDPQGHVTCRTCKRTLAERRKSGRTTLTHCPRGHEYTPENVYIRREGWRQCRECLKNGWHRRAQKRMGTCPQGHEYRRLNTYQTEDGQRGCRACIRTAPGTAGGQA